MSTASRPAVRPRSAPWTSPARRPTLRARRAGELVRRPAFLVAVLAALLRLPYLGAPMSPDEGGFLVVGRHWRPGGGSLYGPYWVDRPPLLVAIFHLADLLGGLSALRLIGCVAVMVTVLATAAAATRLGTSSRSSRRASLAATTTVAVLLVTPTGGGLEVNGELAAAPFIAWGIALTLQAVADGPHADLAALGAGACAAAAVMVKQNMVDVGVFALALGLALGVRHRDRLPLLVRRLVLLAAGAAGALAAVLLAALARGTTPWGVWFAMYPFRLRATMVMAHVPSADRWAHLTKMLQMWASTGAPLLVVAFLLVVLTRRTPPRERQVGHAADGTRGAVAFALVVLTAYDAGSVAAGGSYWTHYVVQLAVPVALMAGVVVLRTPRLGAVVVAAVVVCSTFGWCGGLQARVPAAGPVVGRTVATAADPGDSMLSLLGDGAMVATAGLPAPYPYLWSLPAHVLDPHFHRLTAVLRGDDAPSWVVVRGARTLRLLDREGPGRVLQQRYHEVTTVCGHPVYLRRDLTRPVPGPAATCTLPLAAWNAEHATHLWTVSKGDRR